jgi:nitrile hydratase
MSHDHGPEDEHGHEHDTDPRALRTEALETLLVESGLIPPGAVDAIVRQYEEDVGPMNGSRVVARAWVDSEYRERLLADGTAAIAEFGFGGPQGERMVVVENTPDVHNVVVCTLCSCYPWPVLELPDDVEVRVWDSSAEIRYLVLPERPPGSEGESQEALAGRVTRDAMIGVAKVEA